MKRNTFTPPPKQTNQFKMYVKKGWQGLLVVLLLVMVTEISCNQQIQQTKDLNNKTKAVENEIKQVKTNNEKQTSAIRSKDYNLQYGTYFTKMSPQYTWLDTLTVEDLLQKEWINPYISGSKVSKQSIEIYGGKFSDSFKQMLPVIPQDSFLLYTAHWFGLNEDYHFEKKKRFSNEKEIVYRQFYKNAEVMNGFVSISFKDKNKPSKITIDIARNLDLPKMMESFPYDSLYILASDSLGGENGRRSNAWFYNIRGEGQDYSKYPGGRKNYIYAKDNKFYNANKIGISNSTKSYEYMFDHFSRKLINVRNTMNYCSGFNCTQSQTKETSEDLSIYYYNDAGEINSPGIYPVLGSAASQQNLLIKYCDSNDNNSAETAEDKIFDIDLNNYNVEIYERLQGQASPETAPICWSDQQNLLANTYFFSIVKTQDYFTGIFNEVVNDFADIKTILTIDKNIRNNAGSQLFNLASGFQGVISLGVGDNTDGNSPFATLDITGHEFTHIILDKYRTEPGFGSTGEAYALKEAFCDIFGFLIEREQTGINDYTIMNYARMDENRNMADPFASFPNKQPLYYKGRYWNDSADGHRRNGVINYWFYILTNGGVFYPDKCNESITGEPTTVLECNEITVNGLDPDIAGKIVFEAMLSNDLPNDATFKNFRDEVLAAVERQFNIANRFGLCSIEYSNVYRAFQAIGLIDNTSAEPNLLFPPPCNVLSFDDQNEAICPSDENFKYTELPDFTYFVETTLENGTFPPSTYYIRAFEDSDYDGFFENSEEHLINIVTDDIDNYKVILVGVADVDVPLRIVIYDIGQMPLANNFTDNLSLPTYYFTFNMISGCGLIDSTNGQNFEPNTNTGPISLSVDQNLSNCSGSEVCINYNISGPDYMYVSISEPEDFFHIIFQAGSTTIGQFCWYPSSEDYGTHDFQITATDGHPTNPVTSSTVVSVEIFDPNVWQTASPIAYATNETSADANNGSIEIHLGSTHNLEYHYTGPNGFSLVTTNNPVNGLANGLYNIDVYIQGTYCLYDSFTATVGTNSSGDGTSACTFNQNLLLMRAVPAIFNDQTVIEIELQEKPLQLNLVAFDMQGNSVQNLLNGQVLQTGTHQVPFNGSNDPNGIYIFSLAISVPQCRSGAQESISIKGLKY